MTASGRKRPLVSVVFGKPERPLSGKADIAARINLAARPRNIRPRVPPINATKRDLSFRSFQARQVPGSGRIEPPNRLFALNSAV